MFHRELPAVGIVLTYKETAGQIPDLVEGRLDFGFLRLPVNTRRLSTLILAREAVVAAIPRDHTLARRPKLRLEDFADAAFIQFSQVPGVEFQDRISAYCSRAGFRPRAAFEAADTYSILAMVAAGFGVAIVPDWVQQPRHPRIVFRPLPEIPPLVDLALAWVSAAEGPIAQRFIEIAQRGLRRRP
jgi:DNA-binding transcriptional LysR family regulator